MRRLLTILLSCLALQSSCQRVVLGIDKNNAIATAPKLFMLHGNSIGNGHPDCNSPASCNIGVQAYNALNTYGNFTYFNESLNGQNISGMIGDLPSDIFPRFVGNYTKIILGAIEGTNTLHGNSSGTATFDQMADYAEAVLESDSRVHLMIYMMVNADTNTTHEYFIYEDQRVIYNNLLLAMPTSERFLPYAGRLKIVDISDIPELNDAGAYLNSTYYDDAVHLTPAGYLLLGAKGAQVALTF